MSNYTNRSVEHVTVKKVDSGAVTWTNGWSFGLGGIPTEHHALLAPGAEFLLETRGFSTVTGLATIYDARAGETVVDHTGQLVVDRWLWHKTDEQLEREHSEMVAGFQREREEQLAQHEADWREREERLPLALRRRLDRFHANGGHDFERDSWGYELVVCELAVLYAASGQEDDGSINEYARRKGTSGNQHDYAKALSRLLTGDIEDEDAVANSVSALTPLTGDADHSGSGTGEPA